MKIESSNLNENINWTKTYRKLIEDLRTRAKQEGRNPDQVVRELSEEAQKDLVSKQALEETSLSVAKGLNH